MEERGTKVMHGGVLGNGREGGREVGRTRVSGERLFDTELGIRVSVEQPSNP